MTHKSYITPATSPLFCNCLINAVIQAVLQCLTCSQSFSATHSRRLCCVLVVA